MWMRHGTASPVQYRLCAPDARVARISACNSELLAGTDQRSVSPGLDGRRADQWSPHPLVVDRRIGDESAG